MWKTTDRYMRQKRLKAADVDQRLKQVYIPSDSSVNNPNRTTTTTAIQTQASSTNQKGGGGGSSIGNSIGGTAEVMHRVICEVS